jgi:hypothetical protein
MAADKKLKEGFAISGEVVKALEVKAAAHNVSKSSIVEHALRVYLNLDTDHSPKILIANGIHRG